MIATQSRPIRDYSLGIFDGPHATPDEAEDGPYFLGIKNITEEGRLDFSEPRYVSESEFPRWTKRVQPAPGDVVFTYEATLHRYALIPEGFRGCLGRRVALVRPDPSKVDSRFLLYYFLSAGWRAVIESNVISGATVDRIPLERFPTFPAALPPLTAQRRIVDVVAGYDDLIDNNRRRIKLLEDSVRLLFDEWFRRFRFPGHEATAVVDGLPTGWFRNMLGEVVVNLSRRRIPLSSFDREARPGPYPYHGAAGVLDHLDRYIFEGRHLLVGEDGTVQTPTGTPMLQLVEGKFWVSNHAHVLQGGTLSTEFLYCLLGAYPIAGHVTGVAQPKLTQSNLNRIPVVVPPLELRAAFQEIADPIFEQIFVLRAQVEKLRTARDLLLPRLMSGQLTV